MIHAHRRLAFAVLLLAGCRAEGTTTPIPPPPPPGPVAPQVTHPVGVISATLTLAGRPHGVAVAASGVFYVTQIDADSVTRGEVDSLTQAFTGAAHVGHAPAHIALTPNGAIAFTTNQFAGTATVVDVPTNLGTSDVGLSDGGFNLAIAPDGARLYLTTAAGLLNVVDVATLQVVDTIRVGAAANGLAIDAPRERLHVSSILANRITTINTVTNAVVGEHPVAGKPQRIAVDSSGAMLFIASEAVGLEVLDLSTGARTAVLEVGQGAVGLALSPDEAVLYITRPPSNELVIVDRATLQVIKRFSGLARPRNVAFSSDGRVALVTGEGGVVYFIR
jgi:YVTN family beta-propeller protein